MSENLAVLGLGTMGGRCAAHAVENGYTVTGYDPVAAMRDTANASGVDTVDSVDEALDAASLVIVSVPKPEHVSELAAGALHNAGPGTVIVDLSTIDPDTARAAAAELAPDNITYVDAPVLGRPEMIGSWTLVAGGPQDAVDRASRALVDTVAARVLRVGDVGSGSVVKLLNNLMFGAINAVTAEALTLCRENDVDPTAFADAVAESGAATVSNLFKNLAPRMVAGDYEPTFSLELLAKDNRLALNLATARDMRAPVAEAIDKINNVGIDMGCGGRDTGVLHAIYGDLPEVSE